MPDYSKSGLPSTFNVVFVIVTIIVCCGEFIRIELVLNEQYSRIKELENEVTSTSKAQKDHMNTNHGDERLKDLDKSKNQAKKRVKRYQPCAYCDSQLRRKVYSLAGELSLLRIEQHKFEMEIPIWVRKLDPTAYVTLVQGPEGLKQGKTGPIGPPGPKGDPGPPLLPPSVTISPPYLRVNENSSAIFRCSTKGNPLPVTSWSTADGPIEGERFKIDSKGRLEINHVTSRDKGNYFCEASSILGKTQLSARLEVNFSPRVNLDKGPVYRNLRNLGKIGIFPTCHVTGYPEPKTTWSKFKEDLPRNRTVILNGQLSLLNPRKNDSGSYVCKAENFLGSVTAVTTVEFVNLPEFTTTPNALYNAVPGSVIVLPCTAKGSPQPVMKWVKGNSSLPASRYSIKDGKLVITNAVQSDAGTYTCIASGGATIKVTTSVQVTSVPKDCSELHKFGVKRSGIYTILPDSQGPFQVYCDMTTDGGGWTVFQRRQDGSVAFDRSWEEYKAGFGNLEKEFWLGNSYINRLTTRTRTTLRLDLQDYVGWESHTKFGSFQVGSESDKYELEIDDLSGSVGISFKYNNNTAFSTKDQDNDQSAELSCARSHGNTGWWFSGCGYTNLNGIYKIPEGYNERGVLWGSFDSYRFLRRSEMKMRPSKFSKP